ncbi:type II secretion system protein [bacterium]|nr:MAG: type II secretion system protein [bacterium]
MIIQNLKSKIQNGFTLLEVVVAMAIVGLGVVTLFEIFSSGLRLGAKSSERTEATAYGRQVIDEVLIRREVREGGEEGSLGGRYRWRLQVQPFQRDAQLSSVGWDLKEMTLQLRYREGGREKEMELKTLRLVKKKNP